MKNPNILVLYCDQLNARMTGFGGHPTVQTPNLDALASRGTVFNQAYCNNPICTPSRMSLLSSTYPSTHGYYGLYGTPPESLTSMFKHFSEQGYRTGALGKLHTPRYWVEKDADYVYDEFLEFPKYLEGAGLYEQNDNRFYEGVVTGKPSKLPYDHSCESVLTKLALRFFNQDVERNEKVKPDEPWFAWISYARPHQPYTPSEPFASMYPPETLDLPPVSESEKLSIRERRSDVEDSKLRECVSCYMGLVSQIDHSIGRLMEELEESGQLENTIVVFTSDHGDYAGEHGLYSKIGGISYRAITRVPLFFVDFRSTHQQTSEAIIESVDVFPTLCEMAGFEAPDTVQGISYASEIRGESQTVRDSALTENAHRKALATRDFRYVANLENETDELYNIVDDPWELNNLAGNPEFSGVTADMSSRLLKRLATARKPRNTLNGFWYGHHYDADGRMDMTINAIPDAQW
jgi:arylsulfatase